MSASHDIGAYRKATLLSPALLRRELTKIEAERSRRMRDAMLHAEAAIEDAVFGMELERKIGGVLEDLGEAFRAAA